MAKRRLVYKGPSGIGPVEIYEGDILEFTDWDAAFDGSTAYYSPRWTPQHAPDGRICVRYGPSWYAYPYSDSDDCHIPPASHLTKITPAGPKIQKLSGFGSFSKSLKERGL